MADSLVIKNVTPSSTDVLLTTKDLAKRWDYVEASVVNMRSRGTGPRYYRMANGDIRYPDWAVFEYEMGKGK